PTASTGMSTRLRTRALPKTVRGIARRARVAGIESSTSGAGESVSERGVRCPHETSPSSPRVPVAWALPGVRREAPAGRALPPVRLAAPMTEGTRWLLADLALMAMFGLGVGLMVYAWCRP